MEQPSLKRKERKKDGEVENSETGRKRQKTDEQQKGESSSPRKEDNSDAVGTKGLSISKTSNEPENISKTAGPVTRSGSGRGRGGKSGTAPATSTFVPVASSVTAPSQPASFIVSGSPSSSGSQVRGTRGTSENTNSIPRKDATTSPVNSISPGAQSNANPSISSAGVIRRTTPLATTNFPPSEFSSSSFTTSLSSSTTPSVATSSSGTNNVPVFSTPAILTPEPLFATQGTRAKATRSRTRGTTSEDTTASISGTDSGVTTTDGGVELLVGVASSAQKGFSVGAVDLAAMKTAPPAGDSVLKATSGIPTGMTIQNSSVQMTQTSKVSAQTPAQVTGEKKAPSSQNPSLAVNSGVPNLTQPMRAGGAVSAVAPTHTSGNGIITKGGQTGRIVAATSQPQTGINFTPRGAPVSAPVASAPTVSSQGRGGRGRGSRGGAGRGARGAARGSPALMEDGVGTNTGMMGIVSTISPSGSGSGSGASLNRGSVGAGPGGAATANSRVRVVSPVLPNTSIIPSRTTPIATAARGPALPAGNGGGNGNPNVAPGIGSNILVQQAQGAVRGGATNLVSGAKGVAPSAGGGVATTRGGGTMRGGGVGPVAGGRGVSLGGGGVAGISQGNAVGRSVAIPSGAAVGKIVGVGNYAPFGGAEGAARKGITAISEAVEKKSAISIGATTTNSSGGSGAGSSGGSVLSEMDFRNAGKEFRTAETLESMRMDIDREEKPKGMGSEDDQIVWRRKRKNWSCRHCSEHPVWSGEKWEKKKMEFSRLGESTVSKQAKQRRIRGQTNKWFLSAPQKVCLISALYDDDAKCCLCPSCFREFTGYSKSLRSSLAHKIKESGDRSALIFDQTALLHGHIGHPKEEKEKDCGPKPQPQMQSPSPQFQSQGHLQQGHLIQPQIHVLPCGCSAACSCSCSSSSSPPLPTVSSSSLPSSSPSPSPSPSLSVSPSLPLSLSPSVSVSLSPSVSPSISPSVSPSVSLSISASSSSSISPSNSASSSVISSKPSSSKSPSLAPKPSAPITPRALRSSSSSSMATSVTTSAATTTPSTPISLPISSITPLSSTTIPLASSETPTTTTLLPATLTSSSTTTLPSLVTTSSSSSSSSTSSSSLAKSSKSLSPKPSTTGGETKERND